LLKFVLYDATSSYKIQIQNAAFVNGGYHIKQSSDRPKACAHATTLRHQRYWYR